MAISHGTATRFPATENTSDTTTGDRTFTHTPAGTPTGVVVVLCHQTTTPAVTGVKYGNVQMKLIVEATDTSEAGRVAIYAFTNGIVPTGAQTVTLQGCTSSAKFVTCTNVTTATNSTTIDVSGVVNTTTAADPKIVLTTSVTSIIYMGLHTGAAAPSASPLTGCALQNNLDYGQLSAQTVRRLFADAPGSITTGVTLASDDYCTAGVALAELTVNELPPLVMARY